ncbi:NUC169 domain-domain-containing protein [Lobosporangium transversale]|uniref:Ribosome biogenesis protein ERB1 n=1 Tax=Lobosporangium transversale TaxID=64571 RepID=A0A1Y2H7L9_9FUNG|nr:NUC169 domain-domain-containing protein [Lobosporangium transversale]ORZ29022.1 NUC169 domain-domain-containing protein [Lobosporangium transversale]|eukprot:XP_021886695.1 NUC169 domain-domain-containing protein [Lobosporangium transversale]
MEGDSIVDSQEESDNESEVDKEEEAESDYGDLEEDEIDPNFGHNLNEPLPEESEYNPIKREYPEIDPVYDSDSSTEENENTVGNIPMHWYDDYPHIGYDINGKKIMKPATGDELDKFLSTMDDPDSWLSAHNYKEGQDVKLTAEELEIIRRLEGNRIPDAEYNPYEEQVEFFTSKTEVMPLSAAPEPKRRFIPSKHEAKRIMKIVRAIREGRIVPRKSGYVPPKPKFYNLWNDAEDKPREDHVMHIAAPKMKLPTHDESYNPPAEYLPTEEEIKEWNEMDKEDRPKNYLPQKYNALRNVPGYGQFIQERFERCLDLYLAPRVRKNRLNIDPESLIPKLPSPRDLQPFPTRLAIEFLGHIGRVRSISVDPSGLWLASGSDDKTVRIWEVATGRCMTIYHLDELVTSVVWGPNKEVAVLAVACGYKIGLILPEKLFSPELTLHSEEYLKAGFSNNATVEANPKATWKQPTPSEYEKGIRVWIHLQKPVKQVTWHRKGDYFATVAPEANNSAVLIHQLTKHQTQQPFKKNKGAVQRVMFHPNKPMFFVATQRYVRQYNLQRQELVKTMQTGVKWISSLDIHPAGDNLIIGSYDKRLCWFDLDLSSKPYKTLRYHQQAIRSVAYHKRYPLFASCADDGNVQIFHGMVYNDLLQNPLIVPVKILKNVHERVEALGALCVEWHPIQPWLISSGADHTIKLFS